jgi:pimeloyl-ACP methyl ester carboxylesterase
VTTALFVHGGWHGSWCWDLVRARLDDAGVPSVAPDLPMTTLDEDAGVVREALQRLDDGAVVIGHSWGGSPMTLGASGQGNVRHLIYLAAFLLEPGIPTLDRAARRPTETADKPTARREGDLSIVIPEQAIETFYNDVPAGLAADAAGKLRPFHFSGWIPVDTTAVAPWRSVPTTYVVCTRDLAIHPDDQRDMAVNATEVVELDTGHSPFLSRPDLVADLVIERVRRYP